MSSKRRPWEAFQRRAACLPRKVAVRPGRAVIQAGDREPGAGGAGEQLRRAGTRLEKGFQEGHVRVLVPGNVCSRSLGRRGLERTWT